MASGDQINIKPLFSSAKLPCEGQVGDLLVISPLSEDELDPSQLGVASVWVCTKSQNTNERIPAIWKRVRFDGWATCESPNDLPDPPQNLPNLGQG